MNENQKFNKNYLAILIVGVVIICGILVATLNSKELCVEFASDYAEVDEELSVEVEGANKVSYKWIIGGETIENNTSSYTPTEDDLEKWIEVVVKAGTRSASAKLYCSKLPVVYIDTNGTEIDSKEDYINATMMIQGNAIYHGVLTWRQCAIRRTRSFDSQRFE